MSTKGQTWFADLLIATFIFAGVLLLYIKATSNFSDKDDRKLDEIKMESAFISESLIGAGYPRGWNQANVQKIGITDGDYKVNTTKAIQAAAINYTELKVLFGTRNDFFAFFEDKHGNVQNIGQCGIGNLNITNITLDLCENVTVNARFISKSERLVFKDKSLKLVVYSWSK